MAKTTEPTKVYTGHAQRAKCASYPHHVRFFAVVKANGRTVAYVPCGVSRHRAQMVADDMAREYAKRGKR